MPIDYSKGKIYTIRYRNDDNLIYVGSTVNTLSQRFSQHKSSCNKPNYTNYMIYKTMRETDDIDNWYIELYEEFPCDNNEQLHKREGEVIREIGTLNSRIAGRSRKEYNEDNKEKISEKTKEYRQQNKEKCKEYDSLKYEKNKNYILQKAKEKVECECGSILRKWDLTRHLKTKKHQDFITNQQAATN